MVKENICFIHVGDDVVGLEVVLNKLSIINDYVYSLFSFFREEDDDKPFSREDLLNYGKEAFTSFSMGNDLNKFHVRVSFAEVEGIMIAASDGQPAGYDLKNANSIETISVADYLERKSLFVKF